MFLVVGGAGGRRGGGGEIRNSECEIRPAVARSRMCGRFWIGPPSLLASRTRGLRDKGIKGLWVWREKGLRD